MSYKRGFINPSWVQKIPTLRASKVAHILYAYCDADWHCFPGTRTLAEKTGMHRREVQRGIQELAASGLLVIQPGKRGATNSYFLNVAGLAPPAGRVLHRQGVAGISARGGGSALVVGGGSGTAETYEPNLTDTEFSTERTEEDRLAYERGFGMLSQKLGKERLRKVG